MSTSIALLLFAVVWTWQLTGTTEFTAGDILAGKISAPQAAALLALFVFGTGKLAVMPLHRWLPAAKVAPTPVSALLHAVAVVKAGAFAVIKVAVYILGLDVLHAAGSRVWLLPIAAFTILVGATIAIGKDNLKARLAYSTISNLSYMVLGVALANVAGIVGAAMHMVMHAFGKITLFFCAGAIYVAAHETEISRMGGLARRMPLTFVALAIGAASNIGLPLMGGLWSKWFLASGTLAAGQPLYLGALMLSSLLALAYLGPIVASGYFQRPPDQAAESGNLERSHPMLYIPPLLTAAGCIVLFFSADRIYAFLVPILETSRGRSRIGTMNKTVG
jgi:multicomponent Na+:H+ antiporter subunit D